MSDVTQRKTAAGDAAAMQAQEGRQARKALASGNPHTGEPWNPATIRILEHRVARDETTAQFRSTPPSQLEHDRLRYKDSVEVHTPFNADDNRRLDKEYNTPKNSPLHTSQRFPNG